MSAPWTAQKKHRRATCWPVELQFDWDISAIGSHAFNSENVGLSEVARHGDETYRCRIADKVCEGRGTYVIFGGTKLGQGGSHRTEV